MTERKAKTIVRPGRSGQMARPVSERARGSFWVEGDPEAVRPLVRGEGMPIFVASVFLALVALGVCYRHGYTLLYGDAVAHLGNARRILDSKYPGLSQLGGAWLPLPHILMLPFIMNMQMWQTGLAAAPMSMVSFGASVVGVWRLSRRMMRLRWALVATLFYALNPNLLYLATTAMTETLFLALFVWSVVAVVECVAGLRTNDAFEARRNLLLAGILILLMVFTRYDGWVIGGVEWFCLAWQVWRAERTLRRTIAPVFLVFTALCLAGPLLWFWYNAHFDGDWLDFMRGPYSAKAIERRTSHPGQHYPGWHNPIWSGIYYTRTAQLDAAVWETGWVVMLAALYGLWMSWERSHPDTEVSRGGALPKAAHPVLATGNPVAKTPRLLGEDFSVLLWVPVPFYVYSVAYGAVPIFIPQLPPHAFYNARYGMELLPALCVYPALAGERLELWLRTGSEGWRRVAARFWHPVAMVLCVLNSVLMMGGLGSAEFLRTNATKQRLDREAYEGGFLPAARRYAYPLVLQEGLVNARTREAFEHSLATVLETMPVNEPVMMSTTAHVGAVQDAGRPLKSMVSESDEVGWEAALADPAQHAAYVIALEGDPVAKAVEAHPEGLQEIEVVRSTGQPTARIYQSNVYKPQATR